MANIILDTDQLTLTIQERGETNTASNIGTGAGEVFSYKGGVALNFRTIEGGTNITTSTVGSNVVIDNDMDFGAISESMIPTSTHSIGNSGNPWGQVYTTMWNSIYSNDRTEFTFLDETYITTLNEPLTIDTGSSGLTINMDADQDMTLTGNMVIQGNLDVNGDLTTIDTTNLMVEDNKILLSRNATTGADAAIIVERGPAAGLNAALWWSENDDRWIIGKSLDNSAGLFTGQVYAGTLEIDTLESTTVNNTGTVTTNILSSQVMNTVSANVSGNLDVDGNTFTDGINNLGNITTSTLNSGDITSTGTMTSASIETGGINSTANIFAVNMEASSNLTAGNSISATNNALIGNNLTVNGFTDLNGGANIQGNVVLQQDLGVNGYTTLTNGADCTGMLWVRNDDIAQLRLTNTAATDAGFRINVNQALGFNIFGALEVKTFNDYRAKNMLLFGADDGTHTMIDRYHAEDVVFEAKNIANNAFVPLTYRANDIKFDSEGTVDIITVNDDYILIGEQTSVSPYGSSDPIERIKVEQNGTTMLADFSHPLTWIGEPGVENGIWRNWVFGGFGDIMTAWATTTENDHQIFRVSAHDTGTGDDGTHETRFIIRGDSTDGHVFRSADLGSGSGNEAPLRFQATDIRFDSGPGDVIEVTEAPVRFANRTSAEIAAITPTAGMTLFNTTTSKLQVYDGTAWQDLH